MTRTELALLAVDGMTDADLAARGTGGYAAMINRKRTYAAIARRLYADTTALKQQLKQAKATITSLEMALIDATPCDSELDTTQAAGLLKALSAAGPQQ